MKLFEVDNGYIGFGVVKCFVIAENEDRAIEIARHKYKAQSKCYGEHYYLNLTATCLCDDTSKEFVSEITDEQEAIMNQLNLPEFRVRKVEENEQKDLKFTVEAIKPFSISTVKVSYP